MIPLRLMLGGAALVAVAALVGGGWLYVRGLQRANAALRQEVAQARAQSEMNAASGAIVERTLGREVVIVQRAREAEDAVRELPGADAVLDAGFRDGLRARIDGLRAQQRGRVYPDADGPVAAMPPADP